MNRRHLPGREVASGDQTSHVLPILPIRHIVCKASISGTELVREDLDREMGDAESIFRVNCLPYMSKNNNIT